MAFPWVPQQASHSRAARAATATVTIEITGIANPPGFLPALLTVHVNDTVVFYNDALPLATYSVVASDNRFASPPIAPGGQWTTTFSTPGVYDYSDPHFASQLFGELLVVPASVQLLPTPQPGAAQTPVAQDQAALTSTSSSAAAPASSQGLPIWLLLGGLGIALVIVGLLLALTLQRGRQRQKGSSRSARRH